MDATFAHRRTARLALAIGIVLFAVVLAPSVRAEEWTKSYPISGRAQVRVDTNDGAVQIYTGDTKQVDRIGREPEFIDRPALTRRKNACIALSNRRSVPCCEENDHRPCRSGSNPRMSLSCTDCIP